MPERFDVENIVRLFGFRNRIYRINKLVDIRDRGILDKNLQDSIDIEIARLKDEIAESANKDYGLIKVILGVVIGVVLPLASFSMASSLNNSWSFFFYTLCLVFVLADLIAFSIFSTYFD